MANPECGLLVSVYPGKIRHKHNRENELKDNNTVICKYIGDPTEGSFSGGVEILAQGQFIHCTIGSVGL